MRRNRKLFSEKTEAALKTLLKKSGNPDYKGQAYPAMVEMAEALKLPLREGVLSGDILNGIFEPVELEESSSADFPLDAIAPGTEKDYVAFTMPNHGYIPERNAEGDYVKVSTYDIANSIDWNIKYARDARWDVVGRYMRALEAGFVKKMNDDGLHTVIAAGYDRNIVVLDSDAAAGQFTKRLVSLGKTVMRRNGGGNSSSVNRGKLTDMLVSVEAMEDIRNWNVDQIDEITRREIYVSADDDLNRIFNVNLRVLDELGEGQEYQLFYDNELSGSLPGGDVELAIGLDLSTDDSFYMPVRKEGGEIVQIFPADETFHRRKRAGFYGWAEVGFAVLDNRRVLLMSM